METGEVPRHWLLLDLDRRKSNLSIVVDGRVEQLGSLPVGLEASEDAKEVAAAVTRAIAAMEVRSGFAPSPEVVYVAGRAAAREAVRNRLGSAFDVAVEPVRLERRIPNLRFSDVPDPEQADDLQVALGLALSEALRLEGVHLKQGAFAESGLLSQHKGSIIRSGALLLLALVIFSMGFGIDLMRKQRRQQQLQVQIEEVFRITFPEVRRVVDPVAQMQIHLREARESIQRAGIQENAPRTLDVLAEISRRMPQQLDVLLTRLDVSPDSVLMAGDTGNFNTVDEVKRRLEQSPLFREVNINSTAKSKSGNRVEFKMTIEI
jgi:hypothetical protein